MHKSNFTGLFIEILQSLFPNIHFIENFLPGENHSCSGAGFDELEKLRTGGDLRPVLIIGLDSFEMMQPEHLDFLAPGSQQAAFYLQFPCSIQQLENAVQGVRNSPNALPLTREKMIREVRVFKHTCDNVCMVRNGSTNRAKKMISNAPDQCLVILREFGPKRLQKLKQEHNVLSSLLASLAVPNADNIPELFAEMLSMVVQIEKKDVEPEQAVILSFSCIQKLETISDILDGAKLSE